MKKILIAVDNSEIYNEFKTEEKYEVYDRDIVYKEGVLEYISKNKVDVIITKDDLDGEMIKEIYIKQIKLLQPHVKIILFIKEMDNKYLEFLYNNNVYNIIDSKEEINKQKLLDYIEIDKDKMTYVNSEEMAYQNVVINNSINIVTKKKIAVFGTNGSGKSYVASLIANMITKKLNMNTLLLDLDVENSAIDIYNNLNCSNNLLSDIVKDVDNQTLNNKNFDSNVHKKGKLSFITNNSSIYECQNSFSIKHYEKIYEIASSKYDVIVADIVSNVFLDVTYYNLKNADIVMFVVNPNYISIRQAVKYLDLITNVWNIDKNKIKLIMNKVTENSLSQEQVEALLNEYKVCMQVEYDDNLENVINGISKLNENTVKEDKEIYRIFGVDKSKNYVESENKKTNFLYNLFKKEGAL